MTSANQLFFALAVWLVFSVWAQGISLPVQPSSSKVISLQNNPRFKSKSGTNGKSLDGADYSTVAYESLDGIVITAITETYTTKRKAQRALQKSLKGASIISRKPHYGSNGKRLNTRITARFAREDSYRSLVMIFWIRGMELHSIGASSLRHAQEFEREFYR